MASHRAENAYTEHESDLLMISLSFALISKDGVRGSSVEDEFNRPSKLSNMTTSLDMSALGAYNLA
jgi:hypothetical protein